MYCFVLNQNQIVGLVLMAKFILSLWIIRQSLVSIFAIEGKQIS